MNEHVSIDREAFAKEIQAEPEQKGRVDSPQEIEIHFNMIGQFIPPIMEQ